MTDSENATKIDIAIIKSEIFRVFVKFQIYNEHCNSYNNEFSLKDFLSVALL